MIAFIFDFFRCHLKCWFLFLPFWFYFFALYVSFLWILQMKRKKVLNLEICSFKLQKSHIANPKCTTHTQRRTLIFVCFYCGTWHTWTEDFFVMLYFPPFVSKYVHVKRNKTTTDLAVTQNGEAYVPKSLNILSTSTKDHLLILHLVLRLQRNCSFCFVFRSGIPRPYYSVFYYY